ncbi:MAG TPA: glycoside hydrolase family 88 protein [Anaerohalosphaeraceae bacterium]|nr:glycoside hydrolase family 88 protein [Phycisphaerae bacterium]HOL31614.1 glycoside hydrolase family 88 protein [Anaerohalosphaeraceae bacterium]HOM77364.1 glycoside hydrolase family 88 protein [Anaerohalosphaeraceae bacterium]HPC65190.1 glycoside hydrolase family 88 protein [Anaerohalosphaeraceae bacterium]HPO70633.1 glycoside hydrolase family 88 protein [Anaerohalosphaeraceae bacterium]
MKKRQFGLFLLGLMLAWPCLAEPMTAEQGWQMVPEILQRIVPPTFPDKDFPITQFGAVGNGDRDCTEAFRKAIDACSSAGGGRVVVPKGIYLTGAIHLKSNVNLYLEKEAVISFFTNPDDYLPAVFARFEGTECWNYSPLVYAFEQDNIAVTGSGTLDGNAGITNWWRWKWTQKADVEKLTQQAEQQMPVEQRVFGSGHKLRPNMIVPYRCKNVLIEGVTIKNSPMWHIHPVLCQNVTVRNVTVIGHGPNNDGCNPESCRDVLIENCFFDTGDDCIAIKSGRNADGRRVNVPSENIIVRKCTMKDGHGGVVIGSEVSGSARNIFAEDCVMDSPNLDRGLRLKTNSVRGGVIENIFMRNVTMPQVKEAALLIDFYYQEGDSGRFDPVVRNIFMTNVRCAKSRYPWLMRGYPRAPIRNVVLENCVFETMEQPGIAEAVEGFIVRNDAPSAGRTSGQWSEKMIASVIRQNPQAWMIDFSPSPRWKYAIGVVLKGIWEAGIRSGREDYLQYVQGYYDTLITEDGRIQTYELETYNIDNINPGKTLIDLYQRWPQDKYKRAIETLRDQMRTHPRVAEGGFWHKKIYPHQMWLDGIYMGSPFLAQYADVFEEPALFDDVARQIILMNRVSRDQRTGLLYHGWDESRSQKWADPQTGRSPNFWGRAMGWYAMALVDTLDFFPKDHPQRGEIITILNQLVEAVCRVQDEQTGLWYQVLDQSGRQGNYLESSCSSMFVYAMFKAVRHGYIPQRYFQNAQRGYQGILKQFVETTADGLVHLHKGCAVAGLGGNPYRDGSFEYYISEAVRTDDPKAVGPFILASLEYEAAGSAIETTAVQRYAN